MQLTIDYDEYPILKNIPKEKLQEKLNEIFKIGYNIYYPTFQTPQYSEIISHIDCLQSDIKQLNIKEYIVTLDQSLNRLIGLSSNSNKKGNFAENVLENIFETRYGDIKFERKSGVAHSGDAWLYLPDNTIIILESKNYTTTINKDEILKLQHDMVNHNIRWGIMCSFNSPIQGMRELDFHTFTHNNKTHSIVMISNLSNNILKLDLAIQIQRKLISQFNDRTVFPWIVSDVTTSLEELDKMVQRNYLLRDNFYAMEKTITLSLTNYHAILRDYQYEVEMKVKQIIEKITMTMENTHVIQNSDEILASYHDKKIFPLLTRLLDSIREKKWSITIQDTSTLNLLDSQEIVGQVKIQLKKIIISMKNDITITLNMGEMEKSIENLQFIKLL